MTDSNAIPQIFNVNGSPVLGVLHLPATPPETGIVMIPAGGPQYHVGCARQLLGWGRRFADAGMAVLRFDYRGMGDSGGEFVGFEGVDADLKAAIDHLVTTQPSIKRVVLWGGCNAASAIMIYAGSDDRIQRIITLNPWAHNQATAARMQVKHYYLKRLTEKSFWRKLLSGKVNPINVTRSLLQAVVKMRSSAPPQPAALDAKAVVESAPVNRGDFVERMRLGLERYQGKMLLVMSGQSIMGREFDEAVAGSKAWQKTVSNTDITRCELTEAGHTLATPESQQIAFDAALRWLQENP